MEWPAIGAAATERWSERGPGLRHDIGPLTASGIIPKGESRCLAEPALRMLTGPELSESVPDVERLFVGVIAVRAIAVALDDNRLPMVHESVDHGGGQCVVDVKDSAPVAERTIRGDHD